MMIGRWWRADRCTDEGGSGTVPTEEHQVAAGGGDMTGSRGSWDKTHNMHATSSTDTSLDSSSTTTTSGVFADSCEKEF